MTASTEWLIACALELDPTEVEWWEIAPLTVTELFDARELGVPLPDAEAQQFLPQVRLIVRREIAHRHALLAMAPGLIDRGLDRLLKGE